MENTITLPSGKMVDYPSGTAVETIIQDSEFDNLSDPIVAVLINNDLASLTYRVEINCSLVPVALTTREGANVYRNSLCFLLAKATRELYPDRELTIGHSLGKGYFCTFSDCDEIPDRDLSQIKQKMQDLVEENCSIRRGVVSYQEALDHFQQHNQQHTVLLLQNRNEPKIPVYSCGNYMDLAHGPLVPNTGLLINFDIIGYSPGFVLGYPSWDQPRAQVPFKDNPTLAAIYKEYRNWGKILNVNCVGLLNDLITDRRVQEFITVAESLHDKKIAEIADRINAQRDALQVVLIAGPSSSGKTTFTKKLSIQLRVLGRNPISISLDDYFVPRSRTPRDKEGNWDFESLNAIDIELLNTHLLALLKGEEINIPHYDFQTGRRKKEGTPLRLPGRAILILEGIHGLNDKLTPSIERSQKFKIYVSALTQLNLDNHNRIPTTDNRLLRRIVRDYQFRGHSALDTLNMWPSVRAGEDRNIFPYQNAIDVAFNSALDYELAVLKVYAEPLLKTVKPDQPVYFEARRLLSFLNNFAPIPPNWVPEHSILREFTGESAFKY